MIILGIETSCDETSAAILEQKNNRVKILSNIISSSLELQAKYGGVIPEQAAREQLKLIIPVIKQAIAESGLKVENIDAIAVTYGPGLIGSLLVGVETAKTLATIWNKPLIPINHLIGHFYANWINPSTGPSTKTPVFPCLGLLVSGGHTDLVLFEDHGKYKYLGGTRDDAAGECFDKCARVLGFTYPGGPKISKLAQKANNTKFNLPKPMPNSKDFDFSFSGLKTAFANLVQKNWQLDPGHYDLETKTWQQKSLEDQLSSSQIEDINSLCKELEDTIVESLVKKICLAVQTYNVDQIIVAGGVAANQRLKEQLKVSLDSISREITLSVPPPILCTDNAAMIASTAFFNNQKVNPLNLQADPGISL